MKKNFIKSLLVTALMICCNSINAQSFEDLETFEDGWLKVFARCTSFNSTYTADIKGFTVNVALRGDRPDAWAVRTRYENPTLGDFLVYVTDLSKDLKNNVYKKQKYDDHAHGAGFLGWGQAYINVIAKDKFIISPGISGGDYLFGNRYDKPGIGYKNQDPRGYYFAIGPAIMASYCINNFMWVDAYVNYDITLGKTQDEVVDPNYPDPSFISIGADLNTDKKLFGGFRLNKVIDKGYNNDQSTRLDISLGVCF
ncbi:MAG: hypothetical protein ABIP95_06580 [Pelobium sp.]